MTPDERFMSAALKEAAKAMGRTSPNPLVGCVLVRGGKIIARGYHHKAGRPHAEVEALRKGKNLKNATLYVTLEPCAHYGRTPPCTEAILKSGIRRVVVGMKDPDRKVAGKGVRLLKKAGLDVRAGILEEGCRNLNQAYIMHRTKGRPHVTLKVAMTRDGKVGAMEKGVASPLKITGSLADRWIHELRDRTDAILVGAGTIRSDDPRLTTRLKSGGKNPIRVVLGKNFPSQARVLKDRAAPTWLFKGKKGRMDLKVLLKELGKRGVLSLLVEGGPQVWKSFLERKLVDRVLVFVSPRVYGSKGLDVSGWLGEALQKAGFKPPHMTVSTLGRDTVCEFR